MGWAGGVGVVEGVRGFGPAPVLAIGVETYRYVERVTLLLAAVRVHVLGVVST